ncbi:hypothetical protein BD779DRAFT_1608810 [Infundibulicybe gibba]|nr:hypothetical protein BD779DRAFT_1608810 [Infundibulicybe gibba]
MHPRAVNLICDTIHKEMEEAKPRLRMYTNDATPEFIAGWDIHSIMEPVAQECTPVWSHLLDAATETLEAREKEKTSRSRNRRVGRNIINAQVHFLRSSASCRVQMGLGLMVWSTGASRQLINVLHRSGLMMSYPSIIKVVESLASRAMENARRIAAGPHAIAYDNINMSTSIFVEQTPDMMNKVQSGTFAVLYELLDAAPEDMLLAPMQARQKTAKLLTMADLRPSLEATRSYRTHTLLNIIDVLFKYIPQFEKYKDRPELQHPPCRRLPHGHKTRYYPLRVSTIEEASVNGNILVQDDIYLVQLERKPEQLDKYAIPCLADQLTCARRKIFQPSFGAFHMLMNLLWGLLHIHRGTEDQLGSLSYFFQILEKVRLGGEHPDFHTLLAALSQIFDGLILNCWITVCGFATLDAFGSSNPTTSCLLSLAEQILVEHATPCSES